MPLPAMKKLQLADHQYHLHSVRSTSRTWDFHTIRAAVARAKTLSMMLCIMLRINIYRVLPTSAGFVQDDNIPKTAIHEELVMRISHEIPMKVWGTGELLRGTISRIAAASYITGNSIP